MKKIFLFFLLLSFVFFKCTKDAIDVNSIYPTDSNGNLVGNTPNDNQWKQQNLTFNEMALFDDFDTANLSGTSMPVITHSYYAYPNPFTNIFGIGTSVAQPWTGDIVIKCVIVDRNSRVITKRVARVHVTGSIVFVIDPGQIAKGNYRLYFTYSAEGHEHFFSTWGNIKKQ